MLAGGDPEAEDLDGRSTLSWAGPVTYEVSELTDLCFQEVSNFAS